MTYRGCCCQHRSTFVKRRSTWNKLNRISELNSFIRLLLKAIFVCISLHYTNHPLKMNIYIPIVIVAAFGFIVSTNGQSHSLIMGSCNANNSDLLYSEVVNIKNDQPSRWFSSVGSWFGGAAPQKKVMNTTFYYPPQVSTIYCSTDSFQLWCRSILLFIFSRACTILVKFAAFRPLTMRQTAKVAKRNRLEAAWVRHGHRFTLCRIPDTTSSTPCTFMHWRWMIRRQQRVCHSNNQIRMRHHRWPTILHIHSNGQHIHHQGRIVTSEHAQIQFTRILYLHSLIRIELENGTEIC